jgi:hypothetical protein
MTIDVPTTSGQGIPDCREAISDLLTAIHESAKLIFKNQWTKYKRK